MKLERIFPLNYGELLIRFNKISQTMKIYIIILILILFVGCQKLLKDNHLIYFPSEAIKIKELTNFNDSYNCTGSYQIKNDTVISKFKIQSKYILTVVKLKNVSKDYRLNYYSNTNAIVPGFFSSIDTSVHHVNFSSAIFEDDYKINNIRLISDREVHCHINNDSIKSFSMNLNKYVIKVNNDINKVIKGQLDYYGLEYISSNVLFYKVEDEVYIFIMTPSKKGVVIQDSTLYNLLFPAPVS